MRFLRTIILIITILPLSLPVSGQALPSLPTASEIQVGKFPNGLSYYLVTNKAAHGYADYAIVQKGVSDVDKTRAELSFLEHFQGSAPYRFLSSRGVGYKPFGYVSYGDDYTMIRFEDVPTTDAASSDTTLMMLFDYAGLCPYEQAVIISGDIDAASIKGKMSIFSLMVTARDTVAETEKYVWDPALEAHVSSATNKAADISSFTVTYDCPRTDKTNLNTVQTIVSSLLFTEMNIIVKDRVGFALKDAGIAVGDIRTVYKSSAGGSGNESWSVTVFSARNSMARAIDIVAGVLAEIDRDGVSEAEISDARRKCGFMLERTAAENSWSNAVYLDRCAAAYLYGTNLAPRTTARDFVVSKQLPAAQEKKLFDSFSSALLDKRENLSLSVETSGQLMSEEDALGAFFSGWDNFIKISGGTSRQHYSDTLGLCEGAGKVKFKTETPDPITGGNLWTFSNGARVIYKQMSTGGQVHFAFMLRGGFACIDDLDPGEGACISDMLYYYDVAGMGCHDFNDMLETNGIMMNRQMNMTDLRFFGQAPSGKLPLLMRSLISFMEKREFNSEEYEYCKSCNRLGVEVDRMAQKGVVATADSIMRPGFRYTPYRYDSCPGPHLQAEMEAILSKSFAKTNDGIFVIIADLDPFYVQKVLCKYLGSFKIGKGITPKPQVQYELRSGWSTYTQMASHDSDRGVNVALSALVPVTAERYYAFRIAIMAMQKALSEELSESGYWVSLTPGCEFFPKERLSLLVSCKPCSESGLPSGITPDSPIKVIDVVRKAIDRVASESVKASDFKIWQGLLLKQLAYDVNQPPFILESVMLRYSHGKDLSSKCQETIKTIKTSAVEDVLAALGNGCKVEYVVY